MIDPQRSSRFCMDPALPSLYGVPLKYVSLVTVQTLLCRLVDIIADNAKFRFDIGLPAKRKESNIARSCIIPELCLSIMDDFSHQPRCFSAKEQNSSFVSLWLRMYLEERKKKKASYGPTKTFYLKFLEEMLGNYQFPQDSTR